jgi:hypothetical protein
VAAPRQSVGDSVAAAARARRQWRRRRQHSGGVQLGGGGGSLASARHPLDTLRAWTLVRSILCYGCEWEGGFEVRSFRSDVFAA